MFRLAEFVTWLDVNGTDGAQRGGSHEILTGAANPPAPPAFAGSHSWGNRHA
jgi:hypothetical protein